MGSNKVYEREERGGSGWEEGQVTNSGGKSWLLNRLSEQPRTLDRTSGT